ncbi:DUF1707 domain-containing protein [Streptacidiphilus sp. ASG 303]|uniref:DUF1707 SHOCT-like domain-containing protein n=1 Tax=Streptacidiphilus sp. ASG 303 TaxID=2896847 RepID=UPI001E396800|nr:DUF1707 domain-containing protein [Streptacidiphilus sp. ASG 303]MCD0485789.1 DUF1707 domain-containing protein [Streptacidiphilus sp. ASG 303]
MENSPAQDPAAPDPAAQAQAAPDLLAQRTAPPVPMTKPVAEPDLRASDADRERVADVLRDAFAEGRIDADEHAERIEAAYAAKTLRELEPLTLDLPAHRPGAAPRPAAAPAGPPPPPARSYAPNAVAVFGGAVRKGRWRVGPHIRAVAVFGGVEIDLTDAVFESPEVVIDVTAVFGGVEIRVPDNVSLHGGGAGVFGGFDVREQTAEDPYAPVVRVRGAAVFGGVEARAKRGKQLKEWVRKQLGS